MMKPKVDSSDSKILKSLRDIVSSGSNRQCFDCGQKGVTYVNMTCGSFVCTTCSGILRGLTPPHRVKSISMAKFTSDELEFLRSLGNEECAKTWLGLWDSKRTLKQEHRDFMVDKYEKKRYFLEPASPLKSINNTASPPQPQQPSPFAPTKSNLHQIDNSLAVLKSIQLTPPAANNRHHSRINHQNGNLNGFSSTDSQNNNFFSQQNNLNGGASNGNFSSQNGSIKSDNSNEFIADFGKGIYNSNNSLNSTESGGQLNGKLSNGHCDSNANFADFENNKIYNAQEELLKSASTNGGSSANTNNIQWNIWQQFQWPNQPEQNRWSLPMTKSSLSNSLNSSGGTFNSNSSLNSTPTADRYAALKDLDEQLRDAKSPNDTVTETAAVPVNPFKNPFQSPPQQPLQQSYQNWIIPESQSPFNGFGSPLNSHGFYYNNNMANGIISQPSAFGAKGGFGNPFVANGAASASNPFL